MKILVFIQVDDNNINRMSLETLACGQNLSDDVTAITFKQEVVEAKDEVQDVVGTDEAPAEIGDVMARYTQAISKFSK